MLVCGKKRKRKTKVDEVEWVVCGVSSSKRKMMFVDWMVYQQTTYRGEIKVSGDVEMERGGEREGIRRGTGKDVRLLLHSSN